MADNVRVHGPAPFAVAVVHGGPGARGSLAPVAETLARRGVGVLEPLQFADTVGGEVVELAAALRSFAAQPCTLIGHSWGAWLAMLLAAEEPALVRKLVLVGCAPFEARFAQEIRATRLAHLEPSERRELAQLPETSARHFELMLKADTFSADPEIPSESEFDAEVYVRVWPEAAAMRADGRLLQAVKRVQCPVVAIHGTYDPHPTQGVSEPLTRVLQERFRLEVLEQCGHEPWRERFARQRFFDLLLAEL